jgi:nitrous oxidase accessory protein
MRLSLSTICIFLCFLVSSAKTIRVGKGMEQTTIKGALTLAKHGDTILVGQGVYKEQNIIIEKSVYLKGIDLPEIHGEDKYENLTIKVNFVVVEGSFHPCR